MVIPAHSQRNALPTWGLWRSDPGPSRPVFSSQSTQVAGDAKSRIAAYMRVGMGKDSELGHSPLNSAPHGPPLQRLGCNAKF